jgi:hypothetical protein
VGRCDDFHRPKLHAADQCQTEVLNEQLADLLIRKIWTWKIEPESLGDQAAPVHELNVGVEVGAVLGHSAGVYEGA